MYLYIFLLFYYFYGLLYFLYIYNKNIKRTELTNSIFEPNDNEGDGVDDSIQLNTLNI